MIDFREERWEQVRANARRWWAGELKRPLIHFTLSGADPQRPAPTLAAVSKATTAYDLGVTPAAIVDRWDYELSGVKFLGDAFPQVWVDFGPGVIAAFIGGRAAPGDGTVWFHPERELEIHDVKWRYEADPRWAQRIEDISRAALDRWGGQVQIGMTDLGGNLDIVSTFRPSDKLLFDLYDHPAEVKRLTWEAHELWWRYYERFNATLQPRNPGYTAWTPIYSEIPYYILQCDFCYMIGPDMFDEFVKPELAASCRRLGNSFYHLDGPGQLPHLDSLLTIKELKGVQWVPGAGQPGMTEWPEVYRKIRRAGKLIQIWGGLDTLDKFTEQLGTAEGIIMFGNAKLDQEPAVRDLLRKYGANA